MANLPKEYRVCAKKFNLNRKVPRLSIEDFVNLSPEALHGCIRVVIKTALRSSQRKRLMQLSAEYGFKIVMDVSSANDNKKKDSSLAKSISEHTVLDSDNVSEGIDATFEELSKSHALPERKFVVEVIGKPIPPVEKKSTSRVILTPFGPMRASDWEAMTYTPPKIITTSKFYFTGTEVPKSDPIVQQTYYDRMALAEALAAKLPWQASVRDRNALKFHICREMSDEEVTNLAVDTMAQYELVKGYAVKK